MTGQEVIAAFMHNLTAHNLASPTATQILNSAIRAASRFESIDDVSGAFTPSKKCSANPRLEYAKSTTLN